MLVTKLKLPLFIPAHSVLVLALSILFSIPNLIAAGGATLQRILTGPLELHDVGELFKDNNLDTPIKKVYQGWQVFSAAGIFQVIVEQLQFLIQASNSLEPRKRTARAHALILNTLDDLEGQVLSHIRNSCPDLYTIGPLHVHLKMKLSEQSTSMSFS